MRNAGRSTYAEIKAPLPKQPPQQLSRRSNYVDFADMRIYIQVSCAYMLAVFSVFALCLPRISVTLRVGVRTYRIVWRRNPAGRLARRPAGLFWRLARHPIVRKLFGRLARRPTVRKIRLFF